MKRPGRLLIHTCSVVQAGSVDSYGVSSPSWDTPAATTNLVPCRNEPDEERETASGAVLSTHWLLMLYADAPASLKVHGAERTHRITNVKDLAGVVLDAGPFDVVNVSDAAGMTEHLELKLLRVG